VLSSEQMLMDKITTQSLQQRKGAEKIVAVTAYDYTMAKLFDELVDFILVGDSLGMVIQGRPNTLSVTMEEMIYHTRCVTRAARHAHVVADMPFLSYQVAEEEAIRNAGRLLAEGGAEAVKLEGGVAIAKTVSRIVDLGIPVMGHIGLTPQSVHAFGGYKIQGKTEKSRESILQDALALEDSGIYTLVLEGIPVELAGEITQRVKVPTIGIGAGSRCDGQILVSQDLLGLNPSFSPRFVKKYADLATTIRTAITQYASEVKKEAFPDSEHSFYVNS
jgi:3-methyl-2-oxobutanoate hydroxymethyltransferase